MGRRYCSPTIDGKFNGWAFMQTRAGAETALLEGHAIRLRITDVRRFLKDPRRTRRLAFSTRIKIIKAVRAKHKLWLAQAVEVTKLREQFGLVDPNCSEKNVCLRIRRVRCTRSTTT
jgi:hypothetical protein